MNSHRRQRHCSIVVDGCAILPAVETSGKQGGFYLRRANGDGALIGAVGIWGQCRAYWSYYQRHQIVSVMDGSGASVVKTLVPLRKGWLISKIVSADC